MTAAPLSLETMFPLIPLPDVGESDSEVAGEGVVVHDTATSARAIDAVVIHNLFTTSPFPDLR